MSTVASGVTPDGMGPVVCWACTGTTAINRKALVIKDAKMIMAVSLVLIVEIFIFVTPFFFLLTT